MAKPSDYRHGKRIRYGGASADVGECFALSTPVCVDPPMLRYNSQRPYDFPEPLDDLVTRVLEAIGQTAAFVFIRKLMAESMKDGEPGGEVAYDDPHPGMPEEAVVKQNRHRYQRVAHCDANATAERYAAREAAHGDVVSAYDAFNESRRGVSNRAAAYAVSHQCGYDEALTATGGSRPHVCLTTAAPV